MLMLFAIPTSILFAYISYKDQKEHYFQIMKSNSITNLKTTILLIDKDLLVDDYSQVVSKVFSILHSSPTISYMFLEKSDKKTILYINKNSWKMVQKLPKQIQKLAPNKDNSFMLLDIKMDDLKQDETYFHSIIPVLVSGYKWGYVHAGFDASEYMQSIKKLLWRTLLFVIFSLIFVFFISMVMGRLISKPILDLTDLTKKVSSGNLDVQSSIRGSKEVSALLLNFNAMVLQIKEAREKLNRVNLALEERVNQRTQELEKLNANLDIKIKEEVQKRHEQENLLVHQSRLAAMGEMIGNIAHQWRQPLNALSLTIQNLQTAYENSYLDGAYIDRTIQKSHRLTAQMSSTIDDFRDFFKPESKKEMFSLKKSVLQSIDIIEASFKNYDISIGIKIDENIKIYGYPGQFSQVILNFLNNSKDVLLKASDKSRKIDIEAKIKDSFTIIEFRDNGGGIPEEILDKVCDPYFSTKEQGQGTGIGLYMSKMIIEKNMSGILMVSNGKEGAIFSIQLKSINQAGKYA